MKSKKNNLMIYAFFLLYAGIVMLLCAGSSPIIQYLSPDSSIFYVVGRSMENGTVLYKEIADHKGFYLFAINWLGALLTPNSMNGLFCVEIVFAWIKLIFVYKTAKLFIEENGKAILSSMLFLAISTNFFSWNTGNLGEQFALAFWLISLYIMALYMEVNRKEGRVTEHTPKFMFIHGACACVVLFIQANLIAMWIPFGIGLAVILFKNKYVQNFYKNLVALLAGVVVVMLPVVIYGLVNKCIEDMYYVMFEINFLYSADGRIGKPVAEYVRELFLQPSGGVIIMAAIGVCIACQYYKKVYFTVTFWAMFLFSLLCMSVSLNANPIYYTTYFPFCVPLCVGILRKVKLPNKYMLAVSGIGILLVTVVVNLQLVKKVFNIGTSGYAYESAYQMRELIKNKEDKVLVLGDSLYYNCTGTLPHVKYFTIFAGGLRYETFPYCIDEQYNSLLSGENDYIIVAFKDDGYTFFGGYEGKDENMNAFLDEYYTCILDYNEGGIHAGLYQKLN